MKENYVTVTKGCRGFLQGWMVIFLTWDGEVYTSHAFSNNLYTSLKEAEEVGEKWAKETGYPYHEYKEPTD